MPANCLSFQMSMNADTARQLFESGGILLVLDAPKEMEFGIDMYSWQIGEQFHGIKMIPPGVHLCYYTERDRATKQLAHRQSFLIEIQQPDQMLSVVRWSPNENLFERQALTGEEYQARREQRYELDRLLGQYPLDTYRQWLAMSNHLRSDFYRDLLPPNGHICSANVFNANDQKKGPGEDSVPKNLTEAEARLPQLTLDVQYAFRFTVIEKKKALHSGSALTQSKLDRTSELEAIINERYQSNVSGLLCELQLSFLVFFLGHLYEGFEQWKCLLHLICSCQQAFCRWPTFYVDFLQTLYFQLKHFAADSSTGEEHFFVDIDLQENYIYKSLENLFANILASSDREQMEGDEREKLLARCQKMKAFLQQTYQWTFEDEPEDEKPVLVELEHH